MKKVSEIIPNLFVGPGNDIYHILKHYHSHALPNKIAVLNAADDFLEFEHHRDILYVHAGLMDGSPDHSAPWGENNSMTAYTNAVRALDFLLSQGYKTYVHCHEGVSRSVFVIALYMTWDRLKKSGAYGEILYTLAPKALYNLTYKEILKKHPRANIHPKHSALAEALLQRLIGGNDAS